MARILWNQNNIHDLIAKVKLRDKTEILDAADLILRYDWACVEARIHNRNAPAGMDKGVVKEWHYALNWLIGYDGRAEWDRISTDT